MLKAILKRTKESLIPSKRKSLGLGENQKKTSLNGDFSRYRELLKSDPLNGNLHFEFSEHCESLGNYFLAFAELRTSELLSGKNESRKAEELIDKLPDLLDMEHNQYFRFKVLADEIRKRSRIHQISEPSILDIGGGHGQLAAFLPEFKYVLVEPDVNGISGVDLPFEDDSFDFVVSCHVLEHIPLNDRELFLDQLISKSRNGVILLNPIYVEGSFVDERMDLFIDILDARWAKEHKECALPKVEEIKEYCAKKNHEVIYTPKGTISTSVAYVFATYYSGPANRKSDHNKVNRFFNDKLYSVLDSKEQPAFGLFYIE